MIGIVTSTIFPPSIGIYDGQRSYFSPQERLAQTQETIQSLLEIGISSVLLFDNSGECWVKGTEDLLKSASVHLVNTYQYKNKGISELFLLLEAMRSLPPDVPILKISGRYTLCGRGDFDLGDADILCKIYKQSRSRRSMSTRCYVLRNRDTYQSFIGQVLREVFGYQSRIVGPRSFYRIVKNSITPSVDNYPYEDPGHSIEGACARVLKSYKYKVKQAERLGVEGLVATEGVTKISE
jgi:hypothetical protein